MRSLSCTGSSQSCGPRPDQIAHLRIADAWPDLSVRSSAGRMWWSGGVHLASGSHEALGTTTSGPRRPRSESLASMFPRLCSSIIHFHFLFDQEVQVIDDAPCPSVFFSPLLRDGLILNAANQYRCGLLCRSAIAERVAAFAAWYSAVASILFLISFANPFGLPRPSRGLVGLVPGRGPLRRSHNGLFRFGRPLTRAVWGRSHAPSPRGTPEPQPDKSRRLGRRRLLSWLFIRAPSARSRSPRPACDSSQTWNRCHDAGVQNVRDSHCDPPVGGNLGASTGMEPPFETVSRNLLSLFEGPPASHCLSFFFPECRDLSVVACFFFGWFWHHPRSFFFPAFFFLSFLAGHRGIDTPAPFPSRSSAVSTKVSTSVATRIRPCSRRHCVTHSFLVFLLQLHPVLLEGCDCLVTWYRVALSGLIPRAPLLTRTCHFNQPPCRPLAVSQPQRSTAQQPSSVVGCKSG